MLHSKSYDLAFLLLRLTFGGLMLINHGWGKMMKLFSGNPIEFADPIGLGPEVALGLAVFAEALCALFIMLGLFTRWAVIPLIIVMLVAIFDIHWEDPFARKEKAILFLIPYIMLWIAGPGWYSVDAKMGKA